MINNTKLILILFVFLVYGCNRIDKEDLQGYWLSNNFSTEGFYTSFNLNGDSISLLESYLFKSKGTFSVENEILNIRILADGSYISPKINYLDSDSLVLLDSMHYFKVNEDFPREIQEYELTGIETEEFLNQKQYYAGFHFYKHENGEPRIRCNDKLVGYNNLYPFLFSGASKLEPLLFVGKEISLIDLKEMYLNLANANYKSVTLVLNRVGINKFQIFYDDIDVWQDELEDYHRLMGRKGVFLLIPFQSIGKERLKSKFSRENGQIISIDSISDFEKLESMKSKINYVISINTSLSFKDYISLKKRLKEISSRKEIVFMTELK